MVNTGRRGITQPPCPSSLREERRQGVGHSNDCTMAGICWLPMRLREHSLASQLPVQQTGIPVSISAPLTAEHCRKRWEEQGRHLLWRRNLKFI